MKTRVPYLFWFPTGGDQKFFFLRKSLLIIALTISAVCFGQVELIKNLNAVQDPFDKEYVQAVDCGGILYFNSNQELWKTNSKTSGTVLVKKFQFLGDMVTFSGAVYFNASEKGEGLELWRSTGASYSTVRLKDIRPGSGSSGISQLTVSGSYLFFVADNGTNGKELWRTNGTSAGTIMVKDIMTKGGSSNPAYLTDVNGLLYFTANDGFSGYELWRSDGTTVGTFMVKDIKSGSRLSSAPGFITNVNGTAFFIADDGVTGRELWKSDGTIAGTLLVKDFTPGAASTVYRNMTGAGNTLFFTANDKVHGEELWKSDGTAVGTSMVKDLYPGRVTKLHPGVAAGVPSLRNFTNVNGKLYFTAYGEDDYYFWKSDGTDAGTIPIKKAHPVGGGPVTAHFTYYNGSVFFCDGAGQQDATYLYDLFREDNSGRISKIYTLLLNDFYDSRIPFLVYSRNLLYFTGRRTEAEGHALFKTSGTVSSTKFVADTYVVANLPSDPNHFTKVGNTIYFTARIGSIQSLWKTDGTNVGTIQLIEKAEINGLTKVNGQLYFAARTVAEGDVRWDIYKSDGTPTGTTKVPFEFPGSAPQTLTDFNGKLFVTWGNQMALIDNTTSTLSSITPQVEEVFVLGNYLYFRGNDTVNGSELWRTNGTPGGTKLIKDINPKGSSGIEHFAALNGVLYFSANDGVHGHELWRSNGTIGGTFMVIDTRTGDEGPQYLRDVTDIITMGNKLYFFSEDQNFQPGIWESDGTTANTSKLVNVPEHSKFMVSDNTMYFVTTTLNEYQLWKSEGTVETTGYLATLNSGSGLFLTNSFVTVNGRIYSNFSDSHLWQSDGTPCSTLAIPNVDGFPSPVEFLGNELIFAADNATTGRELYKVNISQLPASPCRTDAQVVASDSENKHVQNYPNPFDNAFSLEVKGDESEVFNVKIMDMINNVYETQTNLKYNQSYLLGREIPRGMYLLKIQERNKLSVIKIIKR